MLRIRSIMLRIRTIMYGGPDATQQKNIFTFWIFMFWIFMFCIFMFCIFMFCIFMFCIFMFCIFMFQFSCFHFEFWCIQGNVRYSVWILYTVTLFYSRFQITFHCNIPNFVAKFGILQWKYTYIHTYITIYFSHASLISVSWFSWGAWVTNIDYMKQIR